MQSTQTLLAKLYNQQIKNLLNYHQNTKHNFNRYAEGPGQLDWKNQPNPFRHYKSPHRYELPIDSVCLQDSINNFGYDHLYTQRAQPTSLSKLSISSLFYYSLSLSAWKQYGKTAWSLRVNPSSGNLHPTECYIIAPFIEGLMNSPSVYHYNSKHHELEARATINPQLYSALTKEMPADSILLALSSIHWRESWKYGTRAFRYCQHDIGHAIAAIRFSCSLLGWRCSIVPGIKDQEISQLIGIQHSQAHEHELEDPEVLLLIETQPNNHDISQTNYDVKLDRDALQEIDQNSQWFGRANQLSEDHREWPIITQVAEATRNDNSHEISRNNRILPQEELSKIQLEKSEYSAVQIIRQRRSAVDMDGSTFIDKSQFFRMLSRVVPYINVSPWDCFPYSPSVDLALFVHRVEGLTPGLYFLHRDDSAISLESLKEIFNHPKATFAWELQDNPYHMKLYRLHSQDVTKVAAVVSCLQDIAGNGCFAVSMLAKFKDTIEKEGPHAYRRLFWETGIIGQILYLEAEANNVRATGIGCFFDDEMHHIMGIKQTNAEEGALYQSLYHFTVGGAIEDTRLRTLQAYESKDSNASFNNDE